MTFKEKVEEILCNLPPPVEDIIKNMNGIGFKTGYEPYIQHAPSVIENLQKDFIKICVQEGILPDRFLEGNIHRQGIIGSLDDSGSGAYKYWYRFMCVDEKYREWQQPYYAINYDKEFVEFEGVCINNMSRELVEFFRDQKIKNVLS